MRRFNFMLNGSRLMMFPFYIGILMHIPADHEHRFRFNVNTISGPM